MFLILTRKDNSKPIYIAVAAIKGFNDDTDGTGSMILLGGTLIRTVQETKEVIAAKLASVI